MLPFDMFSNSHITLEYLVTNGAFSIMIDERHVFIKTFALETLGAVPDRNFGHSASVQQGRGWLQGHHPINQWLRRHLCQSNDEHRECLNTSGHSKWRGDISFANVERSTGYSAE